jgi:signal transduction protein with GAF and PtsI domain
VTTPRHLDAAAPPVAVRSPERSGELPPRALPLSADLAGDPLGESEGRTTGEVDGLLAAVFGDCSDLDQVRDRIAAASRALDIAVAHIPAEAGAVFLHDLAQQDLLVASARGPKADRIEHLRLAPGEGVAGFTAKEGLALNITDLAEHPRFFIGVHQGSTDTRAIVCAPVLDGERVLGAIELINRVGRTPSFTEGELNALCYIGQRLGECIG